jgi:beta-ribofuranosylaminobenzene 5'-phosphate synthase
MVVPDTGVVVGRSRLHIALHAVGSATGRRYGGVGVALDSPVTTVEWASSSAALSVRYGVALEDRTRIEVREALQRFAQSVGSLRGEVVVTSTPPAHRGYGSKTSLLLSVLEAASYAAEIRPTRRAIVACSGRGGTSGIGVHAHYRGGLLVDAGHPQRVGASSPSSAGRPASPPPLLAHVDFPPDWLIGLVDPPSPPGPSGVREEAVFSRFGEQSPAEIATSIAVTYHGLLPAAIERDFDSFRAAIHEHQVHGFKAAENSIQTAADISLANQLRAATPAAVGLSSLGPLIYVVIHRNEEDGVHAIETTAARWGATVHWTASTSNAPAERLTL